MSVFMDRERTISCFRDGRRSGEERGGTDDIPQVYDTTDIRLAIEVLQLS